MERETNPRVITGKVISRSGNKSVVLRVDRSLRHPLYGKIIRKFSKIHVHDENNECNLGDTVSAIECRPISKMKSFKLKSIDDKAREV
ncbi:MAG: 30S ribosomal protein S17 [Gammaproteobacteria bacterium]|nr:30S ribosomal protein S17 [Gammaproteobacteria bacterium]